MVDANTPVRGSASRWTLICALAALLLCLIVWLQSSPPDRADTPNAALTDDARNSQASVASAPATQELARTPISSAAALESAAAKSAQADAALPNELRGRVIDVADRPVSGAHVGLRRGELREFSVLDLELNRATELTAEQTTDASGEFRFELERGVPVDVNVEAADLCPALIPDRHAGEFILVKLTAGFRVFGRVTRARDGVPVAEAMVRVFHIGGPSSLERKTRTAGNGSFDLRFSFHDGVRLEVVPQLEQCPGWIEIALDAEGNAERNVKVEDGFLVTGKVSALATGKPIPGAIVGEGWVYRRKAVADANGEYRLSGFGDSGVNELFAKARGFGEAKRQDLPGAVDGAMHVDFQLPPARSAHGRVVDPSGAPLRDVLAAAIASDRGAQGQRTDWLSSRTDASGRFEIENLTCDLRHALMLSKHGCATLVYDFPDAEISTVDLDLGTFTLGPPALLAGIVVDENGGGLAETEVLLSGNNADRNRLQAQGGASGSGFGDWYTDTRRSKTDALGHFSFGDLPAGTFSARARQRGRPEGVSVSVAIAEGERKEGLRLTLPTGSRIRGRVVDPESRGVAGVYVRASAVKLREAASGEDGASSTRSDSEGKFEFIGLSAGEYRMSAMVPSDLQKSDAPLLSTEAELVSTDGSDVQIMLPRGATIRGSLHDASGAALFGYSILLANQQGPLTTSDANGEFCLAVPSDSSCEIEVHGSPDAPHWEQVLLVEHAVAAGTRGLKLILP